MDRVYTPNPADMPPGKHFECNLFQKYFHPEDRTEAMFNLLMGKPDGVPPEIPQTQDIIDFCMFYFGFVPNFDSKCRLIGTFKPDDSHQILHRDRSRSRSLSSSSAADSEPERERERLSHEQLKGGSDVRSARSEVRLLMAIRRAMTNMNSTAASAGPNEDLTRTPPARETSDIRTPSVDDLTTPTDTKAHLPATPEHIERLESLELLPPVNSPPTLAEDSTPTVRNWFEEVDTHSEGVRQTINEIQSHIPLLLRLPVLENEVPAMEAFKTSIRDLDSKLRALSDVRAIRASFTAFPHNAWQWRQCDQRRQQLESCLVDNGILVPPPYPDEQEQHQAQIDKYNLRDPPTLEELKEKWEADHAEAWKRAGRKRPRMAWYEVDRSDDSQFE